MSKVPSELRYTKTHEWVRKNDDGSLTVGITDHAQELLGDLVFIDIPEAGNNYGKGEDCAVVESVKAASDVYSPVSGEVLEVNESLADSPELINQDAFGKGWIFRIQPSDAAEFDALMSADDYSAQVAAEEH